MEKHTLQNHFNTVASGAEFASYEERRWNASPRVAVQQEATKKFVEKIAVPLAKGSTRITELGAGPGTWTRLLNVAAPQADYLLLDISKEMLERARASFPSDAKVSMIEGDFVAIDLPTSATDLFFSSRAIEYVSPKETAMKSILHHLVSGGHGVLITKMPKRLMNILSGRKASSIHQGQILPSDLAKILKEKGARDIHVYPVTLSFPFLRSVGADRFLGSLFGLRVLNPLSALFAESYAVVFTKP